MPFYSAYADDLGKICWHTNNTVEINVAIMVACMPAYAAFIRHLCQEKHPSGQARSPLESWKARKRITPPDSTFFTFGDIESQTMTCHSHDIEDEDQHVDPVTIVGGRQSRKWSIFSGCTLRKESVATMDHGRKSRKESIATIDGEGKARKESTVAVYLCTGSSDSPYDVTIPEKSYDPNNEVCANFQWWSLVR